MAASIISSFNPTQSATINSLYNAWSNSAYANNPSVLYQSIGIASGESTLNILPNQGKLDPTQMSYGPYQLNMGGEGATFSQQYGLANAGQGTLDQQSEYLINQVGAGRTSPWVSVNDSGGLSNIENVGSQTYQNAANQGIIGGTINGSGSNYNTDTGTDYNAGMGTDLNTGDYQPLGTPNSSDAGIGYPSYGIDASGDTGTTVDNNTTGYSGGLGVDLSGTNGVPYGGSVTSFENGGSLIGGDQTSSTGVGYNALTTQTLNSGYGATGIGGTNAGSISSSYNVAGLTPPSISSGYTVAGITPPTPSSTDTQDSQPSQWQQEPPATVQAGNTIGSGFTQGASTLTTGINNATKAATAEASGWLQSLEQYLGSSFVMGALIVLGVVFVAFGLGMFPKKMSMPQMA